MQSLRMQNVLHTTDTDNQQPLWRGQLIIAAIFLYSFSIFAVDFSERLGIAAGVPYLLAVWIAYYAPHPATIWFTAVGVSVLTLWGMFVSEPGAEKSIVLINRTLSLFAIWVTALLCWQTRNARESLLERERQIREIIKVAPTAMLMADPEGTIVLANAEALRLFDYEANELIGQPVEILLPEQHRAQHPPLRRGFARHPITRAMGSGRDLHARRKDGSEVAVEIALTPIQHGDQLYVLTTIVDISHRKAFEKTLRGLNEELEQRIAERTIKLQAANEALARSNIELQQFAYIASHDLQTPLRGISGFVQLLERQYGEQLDDQARDWIQRTVTNTQRMHTLINDLLAYSRVDSRARPFRPVNLQNLVRETVRLLEPDIQTVSAKVTYDDNLPTVMGDASQLAQLLENLIGNGLKYNQSTPPSVHISAVSRNKQWIISVQDNGIGIDAKYHDRIFEIFRRLHDNQHYPGTGIGLAVCRRVVHRHGGRIWLESQPGQGSTFFFSLPIDHKGPTNA